MASHVSKLNLINHRALNLIIRLSFYKLYLNNNKYFKFFERLYILFYMVGFPASLNNVFNAFFSKVFSFFNFSISVC